MEINTWWTVIERARKAAGAGADDRNPADDPLPEALTAELTRLTAEELIDWDTTHTKVTDTAYRYPLWNAAYLIEGGCGDDGFMDFRDGLMLQGREAFTKAVEDPDTLADLPVVTLMAGEEGGGWLGFESISYLVHKVYVENHGTAKQYDALSTKAIRALDRPTKPAGPTWDIENDEENRRYLPRLAALFC